MSSSDQNVQAESQHNSKRGQVRAKDKKKGAAAAKEVIDVEPVKGTRDFPPEEMAVRNYLFGKFREVAKQFAFQEYDAPILESEELYKRKAGEEIVQQMYNFKDKGDRAVALRPEMTPSLARMIIKKGRSLLMPIKWFCIPQCWRYEQMTRGRKREHYQWNMDIFGIGDITAEAEILSAIVTLFKSLGLNSSQVGIKVNSRKVLQSVLESLGVTGDKFAPTCVIVDKKGKITDEEMTAQLVELGIAADTAETIIGTLSLRSIEEICERVGSEHAAVKELQELFSLSESYGYRDWLTFDASVVRGLAYYTGVVFEAFDRTGTIGRAICGGGRYDNLLSMYGAENIPACGFGFGDCVIIELLKEFNLLPNLAPVVDDIIIPFSEGQRNAAVEVAALLRSKGRTVDIILGKKKKLQWAYSYADRVGARRAILVAPTEWEQRMVRVKLLRSEDATSGASTSDAADDKEKNVAITDL